MKKEILSKIFFQILSLLLIAFGLAAMVLTKLGSNSYNAFCTFFALLIGLSVESTGTINLTINSMIALGIFFTTKNKRIFLSMIVGIILGLFINFSVVVYKNIFPVLDSGKTILENTYFGIFTNFIAIILIGIGAATLYTKKLVMTPSDELVKLLSVKLKSFKTSKIVLDAFFLINAIILGLIVNKLFEQINVFTIISVYAFGASVGFFIKLFNRRKRNLIN